MKFALILAEQALNLASADLWGADGPRGKAVLVHLPGPFTFAYFISRHTGHSTMVGIEVPGKVNLKTLNEIGNANFPEIWRVLDPIEIAQSYDMIPVREDLTSTCQKALASCSADELVCELERRGWKVEISPSD